MAVTLANLLIKIRADTGKLGNDLAGVSRRLLRTEIDAKRMALQFTAMAAAAGFAGKKLFDLGSDVEETGSKFKTVFGESSDALDEFIDKFGEVAGLSKTQARDVLATTGSIAQGMGLAQQASADFSQQVVQLAGDLSSFNNVPITETSRAIQSALTGERESLKRLGIVILETDVQKRALLATGKASAKALTQEEKAIATLALITERAGVAVGDLERTQNSAANTARRLGARFRNMGEAIAIALLPLFSELLSAVDNASIRIKIFSEDIVKSAPQIRAWAVFAVAAFRAVGQAIFAIIQTMFTLGGVIGITGQQIFAAITGNLTELSRLGAQMAAIQKSLGDTFQELEFDIVRLNRAWQAALVAFASGVPIIVAGGGNITTVYNTAADAVDRLSDAMRKLSAASSFLGGLGRIPGLGFLARLAGPLGIGLGLATSGKTLFSGGKQFGGHIPSGTVGLVGEAGPELISGPADITPLDGGGVPLSLHFTFVTPDGRMLADIVENHQATGNNLRRIRRVIPLGA